MHLSCLQVRSNEENALVIMLIRGLSSIFLTFSEPKKTMTNQDNYLQMQF